MDNQSLEDPRIKFLSITLATFADLVRRLAIPVLIEHDPDACAAIGGAILTVNWAVRQNNRQTRERIDAAPSAEVIPFPTQ